MLYLTGQDSSKGSAIMRKRILSTLMALILAMALTPAAAASSGEVLPWAADAAAALADIYGDGLFSAGSEVMTQDDAAAVLSSAFGYEYDAAAGPFTRSEACAALADVFALPVGSGSAIEYLCSRNILNGRADGDPDADGSVTFAEFTVLTYRVLSAAGGGLGSGVGTLKPGTMEYYCWMYLAVRKCVPFSLDNWKTSIRDAAFETYLYSEPNTGAPGVFIVRTEEKAGEAIWDAWAAALQDENIGGSKTFSAPAYQEGDTILEAAVRMVGAFAGSQAGGKPVIFHDVTPDNWFYDGIMYLADRQIVIGYGDGQFGPDDTTPRFQLAVLLSVMDGSQSGVDTSPNRVPASIEHALEEGYMTGVTADDPFSDPYWSAPATREEAAAGILRMIEKTHGIDTSSDNLTILSRFSDAGQIADEGSGPYLAYAVSMGLLSGTRDNKLEPAGEVSRAQVGVLAYRALVGPDSSKMKDYGDNVRYAKGEEAAQVFLLSDAAPDGPEDRSLSLELREDWRLTGSLDLAVPEGATLTIFGNGCHIYEMGGTLENSGLGIVQFAENTCLYPAGNGGGTAGASSQLMLERQPHKVTVAENMENGTVEVASPSANPKPGDPVTLTVTPNRGYVLDTLTVTATESGESVAVINHGFIMPASDVTVTASFTAGGGNGSGSGAAVYAITIDRSMAHGTVLSSVNSASAGRAVTLTVRADSGYELERLRITDAAGDDVQFTGQGGGSFVFTMPASRVDVSASFRLTGEAPAAGFSDVPADAYYAEAVAWAAENGVAAGTSGHTFSPDSICSRAQAVTFLWRAAGAPAPGAADSPFTDVRPGAYYYDAVLWAVENGIARGVGSGTFAPDAPVTRGQALTFLHRAAGAPPAAGGGFRDIADGAWYAGAAAWAAESGVAAGVGDNMFRPDAGCTRAQIVVFLYRSAG